MVCIDDDKNFRYQERTKFVLRLDAVEIVQRVCKYEQAMQGYRVTLILPAAQSAPRPYAPSPPPHHSPLPKLILVVHPHVMLVPIAPAQHARPVMLIGLSTAWSAYCLHR
jgi:hypothetical protein